jgi:hypothetical protein
MQDEFWAPPFAQLSIDFLTIFCSSLLPARLRAPTMGRTGSGTLVRQSDPQFKLCGYGDQSSC